MDLLYHRLIKECKPLGHVTPKIVNVQCFGNIALVHTFEEVGEGSALKFVLKKKGQRAVVAKSSKVREDLFIHCI